MKKKGLNNYILKRLTSVEQNLGLYKKERDQEQVHRLRVDIKRIRAVLSFLRDGYDKKYTHKTKTLKPLYSEAGRLRELQTNIHLLEELPHYPKVLLKRLSEDEKTLNTRFCNKIPRYLKALNDFKNVLELPPELPKKKRIKIYFNKMVGDAGNCLIDKKNKNNMHHFRILIKTMMYVYEALPKNLQKHYTLNQDYINKLQNKVGHWHDAHTAVVFFQPTKSISKNHITNLEIKEKKQFNSLLILLKTFKKDVLQ